MSEGTTVRVVARILDLAKAKRPGVQTYLEMNFLASEVQISEADMTLTVVVSAAYADAAVAWLGGKRDYLANVRVSGR